MGFALPPALPSARCALTAALHPYRGERYAPRRYVLCGTFPRLAPAERYPAPLVYGARTFLPGNLSVSPERPSDRLTGTGMGMLRRAVKRTGLRPQSLRCEPREVAGAGSDRPRLAALRDQVAQRDARRMIADTVNPFGTEMALECFHHVVGR